MSTSKFNQGFGNPSFPFQVPRLTQILQQKFQKPFWTASVVFKNKVNWAVFLPFLIQNVCIYITSEYPILSKVVT